MSKVEIVLNSGGIRELLKSAETMAICEEHAQRARNSLGEGYEVNTMVGKIRANAEICAVTFKARKENSQNNTILKALR